MKEKKAAPKLTKLVALAEQALKKAVHETILDHKRTGDPLVIWRHGKVVRVPADQLLRKKR